MASPSQLKQDLYEVQIKVNQLTAQLGASLLPPNVTPLSPQSTNFFPPPPSNAPSAVNQLRNGEYSHSVNTWFLMVYDPTSDESYECALWFSNDEPVNGQLLSGDNSITTPGVDNTTLKAVGHPFYDPTYSDWDRSNGWARFQGTTSIDAPMPTNTKPGLTQYLGALLALNNENYPTVTYIMPADTLIYAGLWDDTVGQLDWLPGVFDFTFSAIQGTPAGTTERRYKIFARTDRGYTFLSDELIVADAPDDASFGTSSVYITWRSVPGILEYDVYRHDTGTSGEYQLLNSIGNGSTAYSDDGHILKEDVGSYPTPTNTAPIAFVATYPGDLDFVPINGTGDWIQLWLNIAIPTTYDMSNTTDAQWMRLYLSNALDRSVSDIVTTNGDATITSAVGSFTSADAGRDATLTDDDGNELETSIATYTSANSVELTDVWPYPDATGVTIYIVEGGDHGLLIDLCHTSFVGRGAFAPNPDDLNRSLQPQSAPNGSTQGGPGGGGGTDPGGGGVGGCITYALPVLSWVGESLKSIPLIGTRVGQLLESGNMQANIIQRMNFSTTDNLYIVRSENGVEIECSPRQPIVRSVNDTHGIAVRRCSVGDPWLTNINGRLVRSRIAEIIRTGKSANVAIPTLGPGHVFFAGKPWDKNFMAKMKRLVLEWLGRPTIAAGALHNAKNQENQID